LLREDKMPVIKPIIWGLDEALELVRSMQSALRPLGYHVALAGGVLNKGFSQKDLDLVFLPLTNDVAPPVEPLFNHLLTIFEPPYDNEWPISHEPNPYSCYRKQYQMTHQGRRVDLFVA
jgi:hypothetical protein